MLKTIYILSAGRSGSTLLNLILGSHSRATAIGEVTFLPNYLSQNRTCACGAPLAQCQLWSKVVADLSLSMQADLWQDPYALDLGFIGNQRLVDNAIEYARYRLAWQLRHAPVYFQMRWPLALPHAIRRRFEETLNNRLQVYSAVCRASGREVIVDSSKSYLPGISLYMRDPEHTRLVLLTRDGRASFYSRLRNNYGSRQKCVDAWRDYYRNALPLLERNVPDRHLARVKYEDLATHPETTVTRLCKVLDLPYEARMIDFANHAHHAIGGNNMRFRSDNKIALDTAWIDGLTRDDREFFQKTAGAVNKALGYR